MTSNDSNTTPQNPQGRAPTPTQRRILEILEQFPGTYLRVYEAHRLVVFHTKRGRESVRYSTFKALETGGWVVCSNRYCNDFTITEAGKQALMGGAE